MQHLGGCTLTTRLCDADSAGLLALSLPALERAVMVSRSQGDDMVETGQKVLVHYVGTLDDGSEFDSSVRRGEPLEFIVGSRTMLPAFERVVSDMEPGEERTVLIPAEKAYGPYDESLVEMVPVDAFPHAEQLPIGEYIVMSIGSGALASKWIRSKTATSFSITTTNLRDATSPFSYGSNRCGMNPRSNANGILRVAHAAAIA